jgi:hypothetical protein
MAAPKENQFWKARSKHGRNLIWDNPDLMLEACTEYFQWVADHPLMEVKAFASKEGVMLEELPKMRAMTIQGLCIFLGIGSSTWSDYKAKDDFSAIVSYVEDVIRTQKFEGSAAGFLNSNIIARDLGLKDSTDITTGGEKVNLGDTELAAKMQSILENAQKRKDESSSD